MLEKLLADFIKEYGPVTNWTSEIQSAWYKGLSIISNKIMDIQLHKKLTKQED